MEQDDYFTLADYVVKIGGLLWLSDWTITVSDEPPTEPDTQAVILPTEGRKHAILRVQRDFRYALSLKEQRQSITHELLHLHHVPASDVIRLDLLTALTQGTYDVVFAAFKRMMEYAADGIADAVNGYFPLPEWSETDTSDAS
jgi:hypothetical protein